MYRSSESHRIESDRIRRRPTAASARASADPRSCILPREKNFCSFPQLCCCATSRQIESCCPVLFVSQDRGVLKIGCPGSENG